MAIYYNGKEVGNVDLSIDYELANDNIYIQENEPQNAPEGAIWIDTSEDVEEKVDIEVDDNVSLTSTNPVQNNVITSYVNQLCETTLDRAVDAAYDEANRVKSTMDQLISNTGGVVSSTLSFSNYDLLVYYASPGRSATPVCGTIPIKSLLNLYGGTVEVQVADNTAFTVFTFTANGFTTTQYRSETGQGKMFALYGIKL